MGTTEPEGRPDPVVAPIDDALVPEIDLEPEPESEPDLGSLRTRRWPVEERMGRVRLLAQGLFVSAGLASALIVVHVATASPAATTTTTPPGATSPRPPSPGATSTSSTPSSGVVSPTPATTATTAPPVTSTVPAPVTTTTVCYTTPSGQTLCN